MVSRQSAVSGYQSKNTGGIVYMFRRYFVFLLVFGCLPLSVAAQKDRTIGEVQGEKNFSSFNGDSVRLTGIVTARLKGGFFFAVARR